MKIQIMGSATEPIISFHLSQKDDKIYVTAQQQDGNYWYVLTLLVRDGRIVAHRNHNLPASFFHTLPTGQIELEPYK